MRKPKKAPTISDVAQKAGVAVGTVSRYLNGYNIREENRGTIEKAINELGYRANFLAKTFKTRKTLTVGAVIVAFDLYHTNMLQAMENYFSERGYNLIICQHEQDKSVLFDKLEFLLDRYVDGLIYSPIPEPTPILEEYQKRNVPVVLFNEQVPNIRTDFVASDSIASGYEAVEYCIKKNHARIGIINGPNNYYQAWERFEGYRKALTAYGIKPHPEYTVEGDWFEESGYRGAKRLLSLKEPPTALFVTNYVMTIGALRAIKEYGLSIPEDISVVSFDDTELFQLYRPGINAVEQQIVNMGKKITEIMFRRINNDYVDYPLTVKFPSRFIPRESVSQLTVRHQSV